MNALKQNNLTDRDRKCADELVDIVSRRSKGLTEYVREKMAEACAEAFMYGRQECMAELLRLQREADDETRRNK